jgi:ribonuclease D
MESGAGLSVQFSYITNQESLHSLCEQVSKHRRVAFDTEFVAEDSYRPELCLLQVATSEGVAIVDPYRVEDLTPFWSSLVAANHRVVVHAGREELLFCFRSVKRLIPNLFDVQLAAAFLGHEYPASYGNIVHRYTGKSLDKEETRSDWRKRPLSNQQLQYAAQDVKDLLRLEEEMASELDASKRTSWYEEEIRTWQEDLETYENSDNWHRISGIQALSGSSLAIIKALWTWREQRAREKDMPPRKVLRDDLMIELARRGNGDARRMATLRGMEHRHVKQLIPELVDVIEQAQNDPIPPWPKKSRLGRGQPPAMLTQFLAAALAYICRTKKISPAVVATSDDLRDFVKYRLEGHEKDWSPPSLITGWRAEIVGRELDDLLQGKIGMVLDNLQSDLPIKFHRL